MRADIRNAYSTEQCDHDFAARKEGKKKKRVKNRLTEEVPEVDV